MVLALIVSIGGHWAALQGVAWAAMLVQFAQTDSWRTALQKTFDGKHPCELCRAVQEGKSAEKQQEIHTGKVKFDLGLGQSQPQLYAPSRFVVFPFPETLWRCRSNKPLIPPPRFA